MDHSGLIPRYEVAPVTDAEWAEALKDYGRDREQQHPPRPNTPLPHPLHITVPPTPNPGTSDLPASSSRPLLHHDDSNEALDAPGETADDIEDNQHSQQRDIKPIPQRQFSVVTTASVVSETHSAHPDVSHTALAAGPFTDGTTSTTPRSHRGSFDSEDSGAGQTVDAAYAGPSSFTSPIVPTIVGPRRPTAPAPEVLEEERRSSEAEKTRLRDFYEKEGWLPAPNPSRKTKIKRMRALRRLGLCCQTKTKCERSAVIAKYSELAQLVFNTTSASVSILSGEEIIFGPNPDEYPSHCSIQQTACSHAVLNIVQSCMTIADISKDWRFARNPAREQHPYKFYASAPLSYTRRDVTVEIGALCIHDSEPRDTFTARDHGVLLNLANMLVYQLATLQSEIMAKTSSSMYEQSVAFLRRSILPDEVKPKPEAARQQERNERAAKRVQREKKKEAKATNQINDDKADTNTPPSDLPPRINTGRPRRTSRTDLHGASSLHSLVPGPTVAQKNGPRDGKEAKRLTLASEKALFTDAAATLRGILKADAVAFVNIDEYQLFIKRAGGQDDKARGRKIKGETKESIVSSFLQGKPWPADVDPVLHYVPRNGNPGIEVLGTDSVSGPSNFRFDQPGSEVTLTDFLKHYMKTRHFWWDKEDAQDDLAQRIMSLMPSEAQTTFGAAYLTFDGRTRFAMFASWNRPPSEFGDSSTIAFPFAWILGGCTMAALAIRKVRQLEQSQISYSNLQAHELRTPLHQILAITQLLRSSMTDLADAPHQLNTSSLTTTQQIRDLLPFLDAIDTSGKTLHGIVDNILSFLDLKGKDNMISPSSPSLLNSPTGITQSIEVMFEELIHEACEEDQRSRKANGQPLCDIQTVFEIIPSLLGEQVTEDTGGALRRALSKILSNAYKFIEWQGCVEIYVNDVPGLLPPEGCEYLAASQRISIKIIDNGKGMDPSFVKEKLGEPWAKEDPYATGSGLSVHLAYRIIDLMGGSMNITSGPGQGCTVQLEVPVPRRPISTPSSPNLSNNGSISITDPSQLAQRSERVERKVAFVGFDRDREGSIGLARLATVLIRQYSKLGCDIVNPKVADLIIANGRMEEVEDGTELLNETPSRDIVYLVDREHDAHPDVLALERTLGKSVRRFRKPATPSILRETLFPGHSKAILAEIPTKDGVTQSSINSPDRIDSHGRASISNSLTGIATAAAAERPKTHFSDAALQRPASHNGKPTPEALVASEIETGKANSCPIVARLAAFWKPRNMDVEDAVACLSLGDYMSSRRTRMSLARESSNGSSDATSTPTLGSHDYEIGTASSTTPGLSETDPTDDEMDGEQDEDEVDEKVMAENEEMEPGVRSEPEPVKVLVVEDNMVNRKILVKILSSKLPIEVCEAEDGVAAVKLFAEFTNPAIVLLDINMPKMDGYQACVEMRAIEKKSRRRGSSQIIAVTALGGEDEKRKGLVESGMNQWLTKPCGKATIHKVVEEARAILAEAEQALEDLD